MAKATRIVVHFDDGTSHDIDVAKTGSIFLKESKAKKCGHNPPYNKPPKAASTNDTTTTTFAAMSTTETGGDEGGTGDVGLQGDTCYLINGVIVCP